MSVERTDLRPVGDVLVELARGSDMPLHRQIEASIRDGIRAGRLPRGTPLPATRRFAAELGVSRGVVIEAYQQLAAEGYLTSRSGAYTRVAVGPQAAPEPRPALAATDPAPAIDFSPCRGDGTMFPRAAWLRSTKRVLADADFGYVSGRGVPALHTALADYLNRVRGTSARSSDIVICNGYAQGIALVVGVLAAAGAKRIAVEDPSADDDAVPAARAAALEVVGVPVGDDGIEIAALDRLDADALVLTPSHQWPTGAVLSAAGRAAAVRWARERDTLIVEDDYDAEYRYDRAPIGALQGIAPDRVIYAGTASKTLAPGLRLGWLVPPPRLVGAIAEAKTLADRGSPVLDQLAFADFLARGEFDRHLRRMRPVYRRRRDALLAALRAHLPDFEPAGIAAGLHLVAYLPPGLDEATLIAAAARRGVALYGLAPYRLSTGGRQGLTFGYATLDEATIRRGVRIVAEVAYGSPHAASGHLPVQTPAGRVVSGARR
ncbi:MAG TPA: PLP-dependent aminotransferase family protein [Solirubrobacteraceae bacterium]|nr:PLP-dependent aminotransferase family protein [Solirubrobacteraceae bacterium]